MGSMAGIEIDVSRSGVCRDGEEYYLRPQALAAAWRDRARPATLAEGIAIPRPPRARQILAAVRESGGTFLTVSEEQIRTAQLDLAARGFYVETTGVACWAAVGGWTDRSVVVPLCGAGLKTGLASAH